MTETITIPKEVKRIKEGDYVEIKKIRWEKPLLKEIVLYVIKSLKFNHID